MDTWMTANLITWMAVVVYVGRMTLRQRQLEQSISSLQQQLNESVESIERPAKAA